MKINACAARGAAIAVLATIALGACGGPPTERIATFAQSGATFAGEVPGVYDYALRKAADRQSAGLAEEHANMLTFENEKKRKDEAKKLIKDLGAKDDILNQRLQHFALMKRHAETLKSYFTSLARLAGGGPGEQVAAAVNGAAVGLEGLVPEIKKIELDGKKLTEAAGPLSEIAVGLFANARLKTHLDEYSGTVDEAVGLQQAMFQLLLDFERDAKLDTEKDKLESALKNVEDKLPADWPDRRRRLIALKLEPNPISAGLDAARELRAVFRDLLASGKGALARLQQTLVLMIAVKAIVDNEE